MDRLLASRRFDDAAAAWKQHLGARASAYLQPDCLFNGDFENEPTGGVFDWRLSPTDGVTLELDQSVVHSGRQSLRVELEGKENLSYGRVAQRAVVREGYYRLRVYIRTEGLTTDRGMALRIFDVESPGRLDARTEEVTGSTDWRLLEKTFVVGRETRLVEVQLSREPSLKFDNKIQGRLWLDSVKLERVEGHNENPAAVTAVSRHE